MAHLIVLVTILVSLVTANGVTQQTHSGGYLRKLLVAHQSKGIITLAFDPTQSSSSSLQILSTVQAGYLPQWLFPYNNAVYSMSRTQFPDVSSTSGGIFAFESGSLQNGNGTLAGGANLVLISNTSSDGLGGVYCGIGNNGRTLSAANLYVQLFVFDSDLHMD
jgi:6-phosphogluconolactonase